MKAILAASSAVAALAIMFAGAGSACADDGNVSFRVHNNLDQTVGVWAASEKSTTANPWAHVDVQPGKDSMIILHSPDRFVIAVDVGKQRSRSKPVALKAFLAAHPDYVLKLNLDQTLGDPPDAPTRYHINFVPAQPKPGANAPPVETPKFDFTSEASPNSGGE